MNTLASLPWLRIIVCTIISMVLGMVRYGPLFGKAYGKAINIKPEDMKSGQNDMPRLLIIEAATRIIAFMALGLMFTGMSSIEGRIIGTIYLLIILSTQVSMVTWSNHKHMLIRISGGKMIVDTIIAVLIFGIF